LFSNPATTRGCDRLTVRLSYDEGRSWPKSKRLSEGSAVYSCLSRLPDGNIGLIYDRDNYRKITFTGFTPAWLTNGDDE
jgi:sialidase-1